MRAIIIGKSYADKEKKPSQLITKNDREMRQRIDAVRRRIKLPDTGCGVNQIRELENFFQDYQILVIPFYYKFSKLPEYLNDSREFKK